MENVRITKLYDLIIITLCLKRKRCIALYIINSRACGLIVFHMMIECTLYIVQRDVHDVIEI